MRKTIIGLLALLLISAAGASYAQDTKEQRKDLAKKGRETAPEALPLDKQLDKSYMMQYQYDSDGFPQFITRA